MAKTCALLLCEANVAYVTFQAVKRCAIAAILELCVFIKSIACPLFKTILVPIRVAESPPASHALGEIEVLAEVAVLTLALGTHFVGLWLQVK